MSGIVALVNWAGAPVERGVLHEMVAGLSARGPDGQRVRLEGPVGLGHAWLQTTDAPDPQPLSLDGGVWIVADARLDDRAALVEALQAPGAPALSAASDAALILHAYRRWGEACLQHLLGDFAFALWDGPRRRLFCGRDQLGIKPLYYAETAGGVVVSNTLACVRRHPGVAGVVNDQAIADFLLFGQNLDPATTVFRAIRRLPAAHGLVGSGGVQVRRYWSLPVDPAITYRHPHDYVDHLGELLATAVAERLRGRRAAVLMSGGLDSTSVAAAARGVLGRGAAPVDLHAHTVVSERLLPDRERRYAALTAEALGIPIRYRRLEDYAVYEGWEQPGLQRPEPEGDPLVAVQVDLLKDAAAQSRVALTGHGGDPAFRVPLGYATALLRRGRWGRLACETAQYVRLCRRPPRVRVGVHLRRWLNPGRPSPAPLPDWLDPDLVARLHLRARAASAAAEPPPAHPTRPAAYAMLTSAEWPATFESYDAGVTGVPIAVRHPLFDLRLVRYLLAIPPMPWCFDKTILRLVMRGRLPEAVRRRPKAPAAGDAVVAVLRRPAARWVDRFEPLPALEAYVRRDRVPAVHGRHDSGEVWINLRPLCLNYWLGWHLAGPTERRMTA